MSSGLRKFGYVFVAIFYFCSASISGQTYEDLAQQADACYRAKEFKKAGQLYEQAFGFDNSEYKTENLYNAACSYGLAADTAKVFHCLETAIDFGWNNLQRANRDEDLNVAKTNPRWAALERKIQVYDNKTSNIFPWGVYFGILFILFFYNLFLYFSIKDTSLLYYTVMIFLYAQFEAVRTPTFGHYAENVFLWQKYFHYLGNPGNFFVSLSLAFQLLFAKSFLSFKKISPKIDKITSFLIGLFIALCVIVVLNTGLPLRSIIYTLSLLSLIFSFAMGVFFWYKRQRQARFFVIANLAYIIGVTIVLLHSLNLTSLYFKISVFRPDNVGQIVFFGLLSFAVGDKINILKKEKAEAQEKALVHLEEKVKDRTREIVEQKKVIEEKNKDILDSIKYAKRIQTSLLPTEKYMNRILSNKKDKNV